jgi:DNA-binding NtrC family response regulator
LLLGHHFTQKFATRLGKHVTGITQPAAKKMLLYSWPGNIRELKNAMEHAVALTRYDKIVVDDLPTKIQKNQNSHFIMGTQNPAELITMEELERRYILHVMKNNGNNRTRASRILGLDRKTLYRKLQKYDLDP